MDRSLWRNLPNSASLCRIVIVKHDRAYIQVLLPLHRMSCYDVATQRVVKREHLYLAP